MINKLKNQVIVSVQASWGEPLYDENAMTAMIKTVLMGGADALRLAGARDIKNAKNVDKNVPVIGITKPKVLPENWIDEVYITPNLDEAKSVIDAGADIVAFDATMRKREVEISKMIDFIHAHSRLAMADIATFEDAKNAQDLGVDIVSTTLSGYTKETQNNSSEPDFELLGELVKNLDVPVILEGRIWSPKDVKKAFDIGAYAVVVGSAITRPHHIVKRFLNYGETK